VPAGRSFTAAVWFIASSPSISRVGAASNGVRFA
jgi:hypothetical protein